jgi:hypothetical protein
MTCNCPTPLGHVIVTPTTRGVKSQNELVMVLLVYLGGPRSAVARHAGTGTWWLHDKSYGVKLYRKIMLISYEKNYVYKFREKTFLKRKAVGE